MYKLRCDVASSGACLEDECLVSLVAASGRVYTSVGRVEAVSTSKNRTFILSLDLESERGSWQIVMPHALSPQPVDTSLQPVIILQRRGSF